MTQIRIAEKNPRKRGELFEKMIRTLLEKQGYKIDEWTPRLSHGFEIDFIAKYNDRDKNIKTVIGECKAHRNNINAPIIHKFFSEYIIKSIENDGLEGEFYTLSPLGNGAKQVYEKIKQYYDESFHVYTSEEIIDRLFKVEIIPKDFEDIKYEFKSIVERIANVTRQKFYMEDIFLEYFRDDYYWICLVSEPDDKKSFLLLDREGSIPRGGVELASAMKEHDELLKERVYLPQQETLDLDSSLLLSVLSQLDKRQNQWKVMFYSCIETLKSKGDYATIADIFDYIGVDCSEEDVFRKAEETADMLNFDPENRDRDILLRLYDYAQKGQMNLGNLDKVNEISEKIKEIEDEIEVEEEVEIKVGEGDEIGCANDNYE